MTLRRRMAPWLLGPLLCTCAVPAPPTPAHAGSMHRGGPERATRELAEPARPPHSDVAPPDPPAPAIAEIDTLPLPEVQTLVEQAIARGELPGCVVAIGDHAGLRYLHAFGQRSLTPPEAMTVDTLFDVASVTKVLATTASLMRLEEQGKLEVDAPVTRYVPAFGAHGKRGVRVRHLLTHSSGLPRVNRLSEYDDGIEASFARIHATARVHPVGAAFNYSDLGFLVLGEVVEKLSGETLDAFAAREVFAPLGMQRTRFRPPAEEVPRTAPTELRDDVLIRGVVDDPRSYRLGGVAGNAGVFSDAHDVSRFARMLLGGGELDGVRVFEEKTVARWTTPMAVADVRRTLGFDSQSGYAKGRGELMGPRTFGHSGYTGVSLWIDPDRDIFVLLMSNRVHVGPGASIYPLASSIADLAIDASAQKAEDARVAKVEAGIDVLEATRFAALRGRRVALLTNDAARDARGRRTADVLRDTRDLTLAALWTPEHGMSARREGHVKSSRRQGLPVHSLFGKSRDPSRAMLHGADAIVVDLQDVGARFYTYAATVDRVLRFAETEGVDVWILDRPNPLGGERVAGPVTDARYESFVNYFPLPVQHGLTMGELSTLLARAHGHAHAPSVVRMRGWRRDMLFGDTGLRWYAPSPNLRSLAEVALYPAVALVEGTNVSVGRGTEAPFELVGAPFVDADALAAALRAAGLPGLTITPAHFRPRSARHRGELCHGVRLKLTDPHAFEPMRTGIALARALRAFSPAWDDARLEKMLAHEATLSRLGEAASYEDLQQGWQAGLTSFEALREAALLYPASPELSGDDARLSQAH